MISSFQQPLLVLFIYPAIIRHLPYLVGEINGQTAKDFGIIVFNDGVDDAEGYFGAVRVPFEIINMHGMSPVQIRFRAIQMLSEAASSMLIFQDSDDGMTPNRVDEVSRMLGDFPLVVNDLDLMDEEGEVFALRIWTGRLGEQLPFTGEALRHSNFAGFGNTALRTEMLRYRPQHPQGELLAVDWFVFFFILHKSGETGLFTSACSTRYRQHAGNSIGLMSAEKREQAIRVRAQHEQALGEVGIPHVFNENKHIRPSSTGKQPLFWWELNGE